MKHLAYLTADGLLEALGFSQVVRVVEALALRGWKYTIVSLEKPNDLQRTSRVREVRERLAAAGVTWRAIPYAATGSARDAAANELALVRAALSLARRGAISGIHARAYHGAFAAFSAWMVTGLPYLFDARSYWFDERLEEGRWFTTPLRLAVARGLEHQMFAHASGVVTLTELQADDVRSGKFGPPRQKAVQCIPTCADFNDFVRRPLEQCTSVPEPVRSQLAGKSVLGVIGSINRSYLVDETLHLARLVLERNHEAHLLILGSQHEEYARRVAAEGIPQHRVTITRADHDDMPHWLSLIDWGLLLLNPSSPAKRASMPTKLAEFFACGVRPVQFGCNEEVSHWVRRTGSGFVLDGVSERQLIAAAERIVSTPRDEDVIRRARSIAEPHFSLAAGIERYEQVLKRVFVTP
jgi:glycosyltransferase involved in cell wall biosynthesis